MPVQRSLRGCGASTCESAEVPPTLVGGRQYLEGDRVQKRLLGDSSSNSSIARRCNQVIRVTRPERRITNVSYSIGHPQ